jgi:hypothetical protein
MMIVSDAPSFGVTYSPYSDDHYAPYIVNYAHIEHLCYRRHLFLTYGRQNIF